VPTAKEQGMDMEWPIMRGFYMGPKVSDADFKVWVDTFNKMMATPEFDKLRAERGLFKFALTGAEAGRLHQAAGQCLPQAWPLTSAWQRRQVSLFDIWPALARTGPVFLLQRRHP
jgi:hypothetical protein